MPTHKPESHDHLAELGELRAVLWLIVNDPDTPKAVQVQAAKELRAVSDALAAGTAYQAGAKVQKLTELRLKAVKGGKG